MAKAKAPKNDPETGVRHDVKMLLTWSSGSMVLYSVAGFLMSQ